MSPIDTDTAAAGKMALHRSTAPSPYLMSPKLRKLRTYQTLKEQKSSGFHRSFPRQPIVTPTAGSQSNHQNQSDPIQSP
jgi:hypothetical protein